MCTHYFCSLRHLVLRSVAHTVSLYSSYGIYPSFTDIKADCVLLQVSVIAKHEFSQGQWNELNQFILQHCNSPDPGLREVCDA